MSVWIPSSWPPFHPSHSETCGSTSKTQSQHLRAASENCGSIITRGSQGRLYLSVYLNFCNNLRQMRNVSVFSWVKLLYQPHPMVFPAKLWDAISLLLFVLRLSLTLSPVPGLRNPMPTASAAPGVQTLPSPNFICKHSGTDCKLSV